MPFDYAATPFKRHYILMRRCALARLRADASAPLYRYVSITARVFVTVTGDIAMTMFVASGARCLVFARHAKAADARRGCCLNDNISY